MAIIKPGFRPGSHGRTRPAKWGRRAHYLGAEHGRDEVTLLSSDGREISIQEAVDVFGSPTAPYQEFILALSDSECSLVQSRSPGAAREEVLATGLRMARASAKGAPFLLAVHWNQGRFHFHLVLKGDHWRDLLGPHGRLQKQWDVELFGVELPVLDWDAQKRFLQLRDRLRLLIQEHQALVREQQERYRRETQKTPGSYRRDSNSRVRDLIERRYKMELLVLEAKHCARGSIGTARHVAEIERAQHRRMRFIRRLDARDRQRERRRSAGRGTEILKVVNRGWNASRVLRTPSTRGNPRPTKGTKVVRAVSREVARTSARMASEAGKALVRCTVHLGVAGAKLAVGLVAAIPTKGASLKIAAEEASRDVAQAGKELGKGAGKTASELARGGVRTVGAGVAAAVPDELILAAQFAVILARTAACAARDLATCSPVGLLSTVASGGLDVGQAVAKHNGWVSPMPEPVQNVLDRAKKIPGLESAAKATELAAGIGQQVVEYPSRPLEVDR